MRIISPHTRLGWITAIICDRWVQAKVYDEPSTFGVNNGRVSKLCIGKTNRRNEREDFFNQMCYNYDRGLDFDEAPHGLVDEVVRRLEMLPKLYV